MTDVTPTFTEAMHRRLIGNRRYSAEGRAELVKEGIWTPEEATFMERLQHRTKAKSRSGPFVAWDGEGLTERGRHNYVMLCNSNGDILRRGKRTTISTDTALSMLCNVGYHTPASNHVVFGGSYDANMILADLSYDECQELGASGVVHWRDWRVEYRARKFLTLTQYRGKHWRGNKVSGITLWDVIGFFQQSFLKTLEDWEIGNIKDTQFVERMKADRSTFKLADLSEIERYCFVECAQLVEVMNKLRNHTKALGLTPTRWDGAGALGAKMLQRNKVKGYMGSCPEPVNQAARYAYFGGRIELCQFGNYEQPVWSHDIVSAYPHAMTKLPCLRHGEWLHSDDTPFPMPEPFSVVRVKATGDNATVYPLPWRSSTGMVYFPPVTEGWYWLPEVLAAGSSVEVLEWWSWHQSCDHHPFEFIPDVFSHRQRLKKAHNLAEKVLKLGLNSIYGKTVQQVGSRDGKPPTYHQLEWGGYVTSYTRARMYELAITNPEAVISFETDGLYATEPLTEHGDGSLGSWEVKQYGGITYVQSGVYWTQGKCAKHCASDCNGWHPKYRGFDPGSLDRSTIVAAWENGAIEHEASSTRFRGLVASSVSPEQFVNWRQWPTEPRTVTLYPKGKRVPRQISANPARGLLPTYATGGGSLSAPHKLAWTDDGVKTLSDEYYRQDMELDESESE